MKGRGEGERRGEKEWFCVGDQLVDCSTLLTVLLLLSRLLCFALSNSGLLLLLLFDAGFLLVPVSLLLLFS